jgi:hypothetical protein
MPYRDEREALRSRNQDLEREVAALRDVLAGRADRAPRRFRLVVPAAVLVALMLAAVLSQDPARSAAAAPSADLAPTVETEPTAKAASAAAKAESKAPTLLLPPPRRYSYRGVVEQASGRAPVEAKEECLVVAHLRDGSCLLSISCGGWSTSRGVDVCSIDERGFPRGGDKPLQHGYPEIRLNGSSFELGDSRPEHPFHMAMRLEPAPSN